jgi:molybdate transport system substrate-binding protein
MIRRSALVAACLLAACGEPASPRVLRVGAAASTAAAVREAADLFAAGRPGLEVEVHAAASGVLVQQIVRGAPIDVLISASPLEIDRLVADGLAVAASRDVVATNRLVLVVPPDGPASVALADLADPAWDRIAVASPSTAPLGRYTRQALDRAGVAAAVEGRLVTGESAQHVRDWVARGEAPVGIVYATDATAAGAKLRVVGAIPETAHDPIVYEAVVLAEAGAPDAAVEFVRWLADGDGRGVLSRHGFG